MATKFEVGDRVTRTNNKDREGTVVRVYERHIEKPDINIFWGDPEVYDVYWDKIGLGRGYLPDAIQVKG